MDLMELERRLSKPARKTYLRNGVPTPLVFGYRVDRPTVRYDVSSMSTPTGHADPVVKAAMWQLLGDQMKADGCVAYSYTCEGFAYTKENEPDGEALMLIIANTQQAIIRFWRVLATEPRKLGRLTREHHLKLDPSSSLTSLLMPRPSMAGHA